MVGWHAALIAGLAGGLGGAVNALMTDNGFIMPKTTTVDSGGVIWRPGVVGNVVIGAIAAVVSWGLYGPAAGVAVTSTVAADLTWAGFAAAVLVGVGGSRWLSAEVDKTLLRAAASEAAKKDKNPALAAKIATLSPASALDEIRKH